MSSASKHDHRSSGNRLEIAKVHLSIKLLTVSFLAWWLPCAFLVFSDSPASADWVSVEKPYPVRELQTLYIDPSTITPCSLNGY
jgi:hypothetical protein